MSNELDPLVPARLLTRAEIDDVCRKIDLFTLAERDGVQLGKGRIERHGGCPVCGTKGHTGADAPDRFYIRHENGDRARFACRRCHPRRGDALEYIMWTRGLDFREAVRELGGVSDLTAFKAAPAQAPVKREKKEYSDKWETVIQQYHDRCKESKQARELWWTKGISIDDIEEFKFGFIDRGDDGQFGVIPFYDENGRLLNVQLKRFTKGGRYQWMLSGYGTAVFNAADASNGVLIVEGAIKATVCRHSGLAVMGLPSIVDFYECGADEALDRNEVKEIVLWLDPGYQQQIDGVMTHFPHERIRWVQEQARKRSVKIVRASLKPDDFVLFNGVGDFIKVIAGARKVPLL